MTKDGNASVDDVAWFEQRDLFISGEEGYGTYRVVALAVSKKGTILAFSEARKYGWGDAGKIDIVLRRSFDGGKSWQNRQIVVAEDEMTCGNPCPVVDQSNGTIWLPFCKNTAIGGEVRIMQGKAPRTVWITKSTDDGATWAEPEEITQDIKRPSWRWYATGPGHGIQLKNGRLVIPCDCSVGEDHSPMWSRFATGPGHEYHSHIIYSDDHGASWKIGGIIDEGTNECAVVQTGDGSLYINCRNAPNNRGSKRRAYAWSKDNGITFSKLERNETLIEPICQASLVRFTDKAHYEKNRILFSNPASTTQRKKMTVRISYDECQTWAVSKVIYEGTSRYSDLAIAPDMSICCLYGRAEVLVVSLARFNLEWLTDGADKLQPKIKLKETNSQNN